MQTTALVGLLHSLWHWVISVAASVCTPPLLQGHRLLADTGATKASQMLLAPAAARETVVSQTPPGSAPVADRALARSLRVRPRPRAQDMGMWALRQGQAAGAAGLHAGLESHASGPQQHTSFLGTRPPESARLLPLRSVCPSEPLLPWFRELPQADSHSVPNTGREGLSGVASRFTETGSSRRTGAAPGPGGLR